MDHLIPINHNPVRPTAIAGQITFMQLRLSKALSDCSSFRLAAERCARSQPAVSQSLANLERQVGVVLIERRASVSRLSSAGAELHRRFSRFFAQTTEAV